METPVESPAAVLEDTQPIEVAPDDPQAAAETDEDAGAGETAAADDERPTEDEPPVEDQPAPPAEAEELAEQAARKADVAEAAAVELKALGYFAKDEGGRARYRALYTAMEKTREWVENNYYELPIDRENVFAISG